MKKVWILLSGIGAGIIVIALLIGFHLFDGWSFFGTLFYVGMTSAFYVFLMISKEKEYKKMVEEANNKKKFPYCWKRVNDHLRRMPGGQGIEWESGMGRQSRFKAIFDGVQNKPFRSILGYLSTTGQLVLVLYNIEDDDIADYIANPSMDLIESPFRNFNPYSRTVRTPMDVDSYGRPYDIYSRKYKSPPISINFPSNEPRGSDEFGNIDPKADDDMVDSAINNLRR